MKLLNISLTKFTTWLTDNQDKKFQRNNPLCCPIATYLNCNFEGEWSVGWRIAWKRMNKEVYGVILPEWAQRFIARYSKQDTALQCITEITKVL